MICSVLHYNHRQRYFLYAVDPIYRIFFLAFGCDRSVLDTCLYFAQAYHAFIQFVEPFSYPYPLQSKQHTSSAIHHIALFIHPYQPVAPFGKNFSRGPEFTPYTMHIKSRPLIQLYAGDHFNTYINL